MMDIMVDQFTYNVIAVLSIAFLIYLALRIADKYVRRKYGYSIWDDIEKEEKKKEDEWELYMEMEGLI